MGRIEIKTVGSFPLCATYIESALAGGHAAALGRAIGYLTDMLPDAIAKDHKVHDDGHVPPDAPFGREKADAKFAPVCEHGEGLSDYCEPCGRIHGGSGNG